MTRNPCLLIKQGPGILSENRESNAYIRHYINIQSPAGILWHVGLKYPLVHWLTWAACLGSAPLAKTPPWQLRGLTTISPLLNILGRNITANFRKDGLKEWGILLVVCPPSSSGCRQHRPSTLSWRVLQGFDQS